jgi:hypothetical protein
VFQGSTWDVDNCTFRIFGTLKRDKKNQKIMNDIGILKGLFHLQPEVHAQAFTGIGDMAPVAVCISRTGFSSTHVDG